LIVSASIDGESKIFLNFTLKLLLLMTLLVPLVVTETAFFPYVTGKSLYSRILIQASFLLWMLKLITAKELEIKFNWIVFLTILSVVISVITSLFGVSITNSFWSSYERMQGLIEMLHWLVFLVMMVSTFKLLDFLRLVLPANFIIVTIVGVIGIFQYHGIFLSLNFLEYSGQESRIDSTVGNPTYLGAICAINVFIGSILIITKRNGGKLTTTQTRAVIRRNTQSETSHRWSEFLPQILITAAVLLNLYAVFLSGTRASILAILVSLIVVGMLYAFYKPELHNTRKIVVAILFALIITFTAFFGYKKSNIVSTITSVHPTIERFSMLSLNESSVSGRYETWKTGLKGFLERPIAGWGTDNFMTPWAKHYKANDPNDERFDQAHNKAIEVLVTNGLMGFVVYGCLWGTIMLYAVILYRRKLFQDATWPLLLIGSILVYLLQSLALFDTHSIQAQYVVIISCFSLLIHENKYFQHMQVRSFFSKLNVHTKGLLIAKGIASIALIIFVVYLANYLAIQPFSAAQTVKQAQAESLPWSERAKLYEKSMEKAPGLAAYPYIYMVNNLVVSGTSISIDDLDSFVDISDKWYEKILEKDPSNWRVLFSAARLHQYYFLRTNDQTAIESASNIINQLRSNAPNIPEVTNISETQALLRAK
tara:strand:+ start:2353 stop:4311 length:1959 start_codon:yes stop_codon:yes gene_type:complete